MRIRQLLLAVTVAGAFVAPAQAQRWIEYSVEAEKGRCSQLPPVFAVTQWQTPTTRHVAMQSPSQLWQWQANAAGQTNKVLFWAEDMKQGVSFTHPLELGRAPQVGELRRLLKSPNKPFTLACGGIAKPTRQWDAPIKVLAVSQLIDQTDLADMDGNPIARELQARMGQGHSHSH